jgi:hypothetical protein
MNCETARANQDKIEGVLRGIAASTCWYLKFAKMKNAPM